MKLNLTTSYSVGGFSVWLEDIELARAEHSGAALSQAVVALKGCLEDLEALERATAVAGFKATTK